MSKELTLTEVLAEIKLQNSKLDKLKQNLYTATAAVEVGGKIEDDNKSVDEFKQSGKAALQKYADQLDRLAKLKAVLSKANSENGIDDLLAKRTTTISLSDSYSELLANYNNLVSKVTRRKDDLKDKLQSAINSKLGSSAQLSKDAITNLIEDYETKLAPSVVSVLSRDELSLKIEELQAEIKKLDTELSIKNATTKITIEE